MDRQAQDRAVSARALVGAQRAARPLHALALAVGAVGLAMLAVWVPLLDRQQGRFVLAPDEKWQVAALPTWLVMLVLAAAAVGALAAVTALVRDHRLRAAIGWCFNWARAHPLLALVVAIVAMAGAVDVYELLYDPFNRQWGPHGQGGLRTYMLREDVQSWLLFGAAVLGGLALSALWTGDAGVARRVQRVRRSLSRKRLTWWAVAAIVPLALGAAMALWALEGIPHFSDSLTYLMQGRIIQSGSLSIPTPKHTDLFTGTLFFLATGDRYYGKYPLGWPAIVGTFDRAGLLFMANAAMMALVAVLTGLTARQFAPRRVAVLAALAVGLSPWAWFNGANFASHVASTAAVMGFVWLFLRTVRRSGAKPQAAGAQTAGFPFMSALGAGLCLGAAVLIRPFDAAMFALPAVFVVLYMQVTRPKRWIVLGTLVAAGALVGVGVYLWSNAHTTGAALTSPYSLESRWDKDWNPAPPAVAARLAFQVAELNQRYPGWGVGGMTVALLGLIAVMRKRRGGGLWLLVASTGLFFAGSGAFGFTNVWWGPRWLMPVTPLLAVLAAELVDTLLQYAGKTRNSAKPQAAAAAQFAVVVLVAGLMTGLVFRYGGQFYEHRIMPPHTVSAAAHRRAMAMGLSNAVVAMPETGFRRPPLDARAGMAFMQVPLASNPVIYVRAVPGWPAKAAESFPGRKLYELIADDSSGNVFQIRLLPDTAAGSPPPNPPAKQGASGS